MKDPKETSVVPHASFALPEDTKEQREYKAYKLRAFRTYLTTRIKDLEKVIDEPTLPL